MGLAMGPSEGIVGLRVHDRPAAGRQRRRRRPALRPVGGRGHRVRPALDPRRAAGRRRRHDRRARGARPARRRRVRPARHRARDGVRAPGDGRDPGRAGSSGTRASCCASTLAAAGPADDAGTVGRGVDAAIAEAVEALDDGDGLWALADAVARARAAAPGEVALVIEILDALARRAPRAGAADVPPVTDRPPRLERAVRRRPPRRPRPPRAVGPRGPRLGVRRRQRVAACGSRSWTPASRARTRRSAGGSSESVVVERDGEGWRSSTTSSPTTWSATGRRAPGSSTPSRPRRSWSRSACSAATTGATAAGSRPASSGRSRRRGRRSSTCRCPRAATRSSRPLHELADEAYFRNVLLVSAANNVAGRELPVAVRGGRVGRGPRRAERGGLVLQPGSRRSSSAPTGSTSTSPGAAARG